VLGDDVVHFSFFFGDFTSDELIFAEDGFHFSTHSAGFRHRDGVFRAF
jgi:hypothetical protein